MDVLKFFSEFRRMCKSSSDCTKCQYHGDKCDNAIELFGKTVATVEKWSQEHPCKTRQSNLLEMFPTARLDCHGVLVVCPVNIDVSNRADDGACANLNIGCDECRREFWMQEVE